MATRPAPYRPTIKAWSQGSPHLINEPLRPLQEGEIVKLGDSSSKLINYNYRIVLQKNFIKFRRKIKFEKIPYYLNLIKIQPKMIRYGWIATNTINLIFYSLPDTAPPSILHRYQIKVGRPKFENHIHNMQ